ncbi:DEAD/DEAH box helicase [Ancylobacter sp. TS-1]|uniref:DEAD/DEAH box helicase n=1 Tax=Ancylobacter sp. TS-1 TaxID=1850374 RepID=UPI001265CD1E|nr:DEAD/DEAH box helicase [Ancylobacter sp. TS-1]
MTTNPALGRALAERDYNDPTPVQLAVLAPETAGRDLLVSAQTGSGKTVAYGLAMAETLLGTDERFGPAAAPQALVVAPTRELALQVQREFAWLYTATDARIVACVGGMDPRQEQRLLNQGAHIVVGTPGRLRDHLERGRLDISAVRVVVLDEADEMLDLGFREDLEFILNATPAERRSLLFSATLPRGISALAKRYQRDALRIDITGAEGGHADIEYRALRIAPKQMEHVAINVLRFYDAPSAIVFCNTREAVRHLHAMLQERQFSAVALSGELSQNERNLALQSLRDGRARVCVATDVAARGIDLPSLGLVIHAELPNDAESLQHRSGRTGRAGRKGISVLLVPPARRRRAQDLLAGLGVAATWSGPPTADEIRALDHERMLVDPLLTEAPGEDDAAAARTLLATHSAEHLAAALARMYRASLPAPEEVEDPGEPRSARERPVRGAFDGPVAAGESAWFRLTIGRRQNADPKWLLPLICRRGNVTRRDIGAIRIFDEETAFEVGLAAVERFSKAAGRPDSSGALIEPLEGPPPAGGPRSGGSRPGGARSGADRPGRDSPRADAPGGTRSEGWTPLPRERPAPYKAPYKPARDDRPETTRPETTRPEPTRPETRQPEAARPAPDRPARPAPRYERTRDDTPRRPEGARAERRDAPAGPPAGEFKGKPKGAPKGAFKGAHKAGSKGAPAGAPTGAAKGKPKGLSKGKPKGKPNGKPPRRGHD